VQGLVRAEEAGIPTCTIKHHDYPSRAAFEAALNDALKQSRVELLCNAGFMRLLTEGFVSCWLDRHLNIHPSLLPAFRGLDTHARVLAAGARITGCTVHFVRAGMDDGPIVAQAAVPVLTGDTEVALAARVLTAEHRLYPHALRLVASGEAQVRGDHVEGMPKGSGEPALFSPPLRGNS
jgi:phosphoribosylglycinamide formyltransferase-1